MRFYFDDGYRKSLSSFFCFNFCVWPGSRSRRVLREFFTFFGWRYRFFYHFFAFSLYRFRLVNLVSRAGFRNFWNVFFCSFFFQSFCIFGFFLLCLFLFGLFDSFLNSLGDLWNVFLLIGFIYENIFFIY